MKLTTTLIVYHHLAVVKKADPATSRLQHVKNSVNEFIAPNRARLYYCRLMI